MRLINWLWGWLLRKVGLDQTNAYLDWMVSTWPSKETP